MFDLTGKVALITGAQQGMGKPEEVASMAVFLSSEEASYITGAVFYVGGGWLAARIKKDRLVSVMLQHVVGKIIERLYMLSKEGNLHRQGKVA